MLNSSTLGCVFFILCTCIWFMLERSVIGALYTMWWRLPGLRLPTVGTRSVHSLLWFRDWWGTTIFYFFQSLLIPSAFFHHDTSVVIKDYAKCLDHLYAFSHWYEGLGRGGLISYAWIWALSSLRELCALRAFPRKIRKVWRQLVIYISELSSRC